MAGVVLLVAGVLWLKNRPATTENVAAGPPVLVTPTGAGVVEVPESLEVLLPGEETAATPVSAVETSLAPRAGESPEAHLDRLLEEGQPVFAFFHSYTCYQCTEMDKIVQQVHPAFAEQVALVAGVPAHLFGRDCHQHRAVQRGDDPAGDRLRG